ncbi:MAG: hypothetical protein WCJ30_22695 [Deltaproteobacteria bacterium]
MPRLIEAHVAWQSASPGRARERARERLALAVRRFLTLEMSRHGRRDQRSEDTIQVAAMRMLAKIEAGGVRPGSEAAYLRRVAFTVSVDCHRRLERESRTADASWSARDDDGERGWERVPVLDREPEERIDVTRMVALMRARLAELPARYRAVLVDVYLAERTLEELTDDEVVRREERIGRPLDPREVARARNAVDVLLGRARRALLALMGGMPQRRAA